MNVVVTIKGGCLQDVFSDIPELDVVLVDYDSYDDGSDGDKYAEYFAHNPMTDLDELTSAALVTVENAGVAYVCDPSAH
jgi:hypothetical protein